MRELLTYKLTRHTFLGQLSLAQLALHALTFLVLQVTSAKHSENDAILGQVVLRDHHPTHCYGPQKSTASCKLVST